MSQRAFRVRQATMLRDLREENARLKRVIKDMVEVSQSDDWPALRSAIRKAAEAADLSSELPHHSSSSSGPGSLVHSAVTSATAGVSTESPWDDISYLAMQQQARLTEDADSAVHLDLWILRLILGLTNTLSPPKSTGTAPEQVLAFSTNLPASSPAELRPSLNSTLSSQLC